MEGSALGEEPMEPRQAVMGDRRQKVVLEVEIDVMGGQDEPREEGSAGCARVQEGSINSVFLEVSTEKLA